MFIDFLLLQTGVNAYLNSHRKESRWENTRFIEFLSFELFGTLRELLFERDKLGIVLWSPKWKESVILVYTGVSIPTVCASGRTFNFKLRIAGMKTKKPEGRKNLYSVARHVFDHIHDNETKPNYEKYSLFTL